MKNQLTIFPSVDNLVISPADLYLLIYPQLKISKNRVNVSGPISSGWLALDKNYQILSAIRLNCEFAKLLVTAYLEKNNLNHFHCTLPHALGKCYRFTLQGKNTWLQFDYLCLWVLTILGLKPDLVNDFINILEGGKIDLNIFNGHEIKREIRQKEHQKFLDLVINFINNYASKSDFNLTNELLILPLAEGSLGSNLEIGLAKRFNIPIKKLILDDDFLKDQRQLIAHQVFKYIQQKGLDHVV